MSQIDQRYCGKATEIVAKELDLGYRVRLYSPHPEIKMVVVSDDRLSHDHGAPITPPEMVEIANQTVRAFQLNPAQVVWIEHLPSRSGSPSCADFHLIQFDWHAGQATSCHRSPLYEDWYLSWLEAELYPVN